MKTVYRLLFALHLFVGIGAIFGGSAAIINPEGPLGITVDALKNSPFNNFLIPGIILFTIIGLGNIFSALMFRFKSKFQGYISGVFSGALVIWIVVQCIMLETVVFLHILYFMIGVIEGVLSAIILFNKRLFPANLIMDFIEGRKQMKKRVFGALIGIIILVIGYYIFSINVGVHPRIKVSEVQSITINNKIFENEFNNNSIEKFINIYNSAKPFKKNHDTTPAYIVDIKLISGNEINILGTSQGFHYVNDGENSYKISSAEMTYYLSDLMKQE